MSLVQQRSLCSKRGRMIDRTSLYLLQQQSKMRRMMIIPQQLSSPKRPPMNPSLHLSPTVCTSSRVLWPPGSSEERPGNLRSPAMLLPSEKPIGRMLIVGPGIVYGAYVCFAVVASPCGTMAKGPRHSNGGGALRKIRGASGGLHRPWRTGHPCHLHPPPSLSLSPSGHVTKPNILARQWQFG